jgi:hypothetical protein
MAPKVVEIGNIIEGKFERVELSREVAAHLISAMYAAFAPMKLTGPTMEPPDGTQLLTTGLWRLMVWSPGCGTISEIRE